MAKCISMCVNTQPSWSGVDTVLQKPRSSKESTDHLTTPQWEDQQVTPREDKELDSSQEDNSPLRSWRELPGEYCFYALSVTPWRGTEVLPIPVGQSWSVQPLTAWLLPQAGQCPPPPPKHPCPILLHGKWNWGRCDSGKDLEMEGPSRLIWVGSVYSQGS